MLKLPTQKNAVIVLLIGFLSPSALYAQNAPSPPCAGTPVPTYAAIGKEPNIQVWNSSSLENWVPPPCVGWTGRSGNLIVALAGTVSLTNSADEILARVGAISALSGIRYWSVTDKAWRVLVSEAAALEDAAVNIRRRDFSPDELKTGRALHFAQKDTRSTGEVIYRMQVREFNDNHFILALENVTSVKAFFITLFNPGEMKFSYFFDRGSDGAWHSYLLLSAKTSFAAGNEKSVINRAVAFYRAFTGVATDGSPPMAP